MGKTVYIDPSAHVSPLAVIGGGTKVWINSQIREDVTIGEDCVISKDTYLDFSVRVGDRVKIQNGVSVYHGVTLEDDVFVGPNAAFTNDFYPRAANSEFPVRNTLVKRGASIGANATVVCGNTLGEYCMVGAGSVVTHPVAPYTLVVGNPARPVAMVCRCGLKRVSLDTLCPQCGFMMGTSTAAAEPEV